MFMSLPSFSGVCDMNIKVFCQIRSHSGIFLVIGPFFYDVFSKNFFQFLWEIKGE